MTTSGTNKRKSLAITASDSLSLLTSQLCQGSLGNLKMNRIHRTATKLEYVRTQAELLRGINPSYTLIKLCANSASDLSSTAKSLLHSLSDREVERDGQIR